jgi:hypothetical protein
LLALIQTSHHHMYILTMNGCLLVCTVYIVRISAAPLATATSSAACGSATSSEMLQHFASQLLRLYVTNHLRPLTATQRLTSNVQNVTAGIMYCFVF